MQPASPQDNHSHIQTQWSCGLVTLTTLGCEQFEPEDTATIHWMEFELTRGLASSDGLRLGAQCYHLKGRGGIKKVINYLQDLLSKSRLADKLSTKLNHASRLYEQGTLSNLQHLESYLNNWIRYMKGNQRLRFRASIQAISAIIQQRISTKIHDLMETHFLSARLNWVKQQETLDYEIKYKNKISRGPWSTSWIIT